MRPNFQAKRTTLTLLAQICPKIWGRNFGILLDSESAPPIYHARQFSGETNNFEFFDLNLGKLLNYVRYFGSYNVEGIAESWVGAEMSWGEVDGAGWS